MRVYLMNNDAKEALIQPRRTRLLTQLKDTIGSEELAIIETKSLMLNFSRSLTKPSLKDRNRKEYLIINFRFLRGLLGTIPMVPALTLDHLSSLESALDNLLQAIDDHPDPIPSISNYPLHTHLVGIIESFDVNQLFSLKQKIAIGAYLKNYILIRENEENHCNKDATLDEKTYRTHLTRYGDYREEVDRELESSIQYAQGYLDRYIAIEQSRNLQARW